ncbi:MAG: lipoyl(octanoyl) transferase LipB, partial [Shewanella sp.]
GGPQTVVEAGEQLIITFSQLLGYQHLVHHQGLAAT